MTDKKLHPLEMLALEQLPWDDRVKRIAAMYLDGKFGGTVDPNPDNKVVKSLVDRIGEPWGKKGLLRDELKDAIVHHASERRERSRSRRKYSHTYLDEFTVDFALFHAWSSEAIRNCLVRKRIGSSYGNLDRVCKWFTTRVPCPNFVHTRLSKGTAIALFSPGSVWNGQSYARDAEHHKTRYLLFKVGDVSGNVRVSWECTTIGEAIESLKTSKVTTAEAKHYEVEIDWSNRCFRIKAPRRKEWHEVPFKQWSRAKKTSEGSR